MNTKKIRVRRLVGKIKRKLNCSAFIIISLIFFNRDSIRKAREACLIMKGRTIHPDGLNMREETY